MSCTNGADTARAFNAAGITTCLTSAAVAATGTAIGGYTGTGNKYGSSPLFGSVGTGPGSGVVTFGSIDGGITGTDEEDGEGSVVDTAVEAVVVTPGNVVDGCTATLVTDTAGDADGGGGVTGVVVGEPGGTGAPVEGVDAVGAVVGVAFGVTEFAGIVDEGGTALCADTELDSTDPTRPTVTNNTHARTAR